ncbi:MAG: ribose-phosphate pyrophosphokinase [Clostridiaceae bacterium]|nr:ribose-phosphate pyrophosphokinase [Clostridiaceae bacterium]
MAKSKKAIKRDDKNYYRYDQYGDNPMPADAPVGIISLVGAKEFGVKVNKQLVKRRKEYLKMTDAESVASPGFLRDDYRIKAEAVRFSTGEGKGVLEQTVRGHDLYIICDVTNYSCTYKMRGLINHYSPDDHYQDLKRIILAASGKARRINVIMPFLYESRQHRRTGRESLDCAYMLEDIFDLGISNFITFDAHDDRVANAVPTHSFESIQSNYQILKALTSKVKDIKIQPDSLMIISPDEGAISRSMYYASMLNVPLGTFYKRRDYAKVIDGRNPIIAHEFLGDSVEGYDVLIIDDMLSSGESMLDLAKVLKSKGARRIFCAVTFALFTDGIEEFNNYYEKGLIDKVIATNLCYLPDEILNTPWFIEADMTKFVALLIDAMNHNAAMSSLITPTAKINTLLEKLKKKS